MTATLLMISALISTIISALLYSIISAVLICTSKRFARGYDVFINPLVSYTIIAGMSMILTAPIYNLLEILTK